eukprot:CAMPEP_0194297638 /NCGR_PEP_ID=MMETSP0169-20130528/59373_1 /TAXON_ID=218684 /ORGANISM="Corethron pennatum, Strain L29A3" /LENGTH=386 /DNA_ID=CAMNT_0039047499 /DNA_START=105 /DNA_END=1261 /DNA_ORIENTATION=+
MAGPSAPLSRRQIQLARQRQRSNSSPHTHVPIPAGRATPYLPAPHRPTSHRRSSLTTSSSPPTSAAGASSVVSSSVCSTASTELMRSHAHIRQRNSRILQTAVAARNRVGASVPAPATERSAHVHDDSLTYSDHGTPDSSAELVAQDADETQWYPPSPPPRAPSLPPPPTPPTQATPLRGRAISQETPVRSNIDRRPSATHDPITSSPKPALSPMLAAATRRAAGRNRFGAAHKNRYAGPSTKPSPPPNMSTIPPLKMPSLGITIPAPADAVTFVESRGRSRSPVAEPTHYVQHSPPRNSPTRKATDTSQQRRGRSAVQLLEAAKSAVPTPEGTQEVARRRSPTRKAIDMGKSLVREMVPPGFSCSSNYTYEEPARPVYEEPARPA